MNIKIGKEVKVEMKVSLTVKLAMVIAMMTLLIFAGYSIRPASVSAGAQNPTDSTVIEWYGNWGMQQIVFSEFSSYSKLQGLRLTVYKPTGACWLSNVSEPGNISAMVQIDPQVCRTEFGF